MTDAKKAAKRAKFAKGLNRVREKAEEAENTFERQMQVVLAEEVLKATLRRRKSQGK